MKNDLQTDPVDSQEVESLRRQLETARRKISALEARANEDSLLGVLNRRGMEAELDRAIAFSGRYGMVASVIFIDLDEFKQINDTHGHDAGDAGLRHVVMIIENNIRTSDLLARIGGDEFVILLWNATREIAESKARSLTAIVERTRLARGEEQIRLSISCGVAELRSDDTAAMVLSRADAAMYAAKKSARREKS